VVSGFALFGLVLGVTAFLAWINERWFKLPTAIGVMAGALVLSLSLFGLEAVGILDDAWAMNIIEQFDFGDVLMKGMLSFLLFAGALHVDLGDLLHRKWSIGILATLGVVFSTFLVGTLFWLLARAFGFELPWIWALAFGALISPTDPVAVLGVMKGAKAPASLSSMVAGESLFNDGVGVVVFTVIAGLVVGDGHLDTRHVGELFIVEALGGIVFGLVLGWIAYRMLKTIDRHPVEILITLALVGGGYALAGKLHTSGPIAMVAAGLFMGNHGRFFGMSEGTRDALDDFWEVVDEILNAILFVMIGLELLVLAFSGKRVLLGLATIPLVLSVRFVSVGIPITMLRKVRDYVPHTVKLMTWCGVRGGISIALALALPASPYRELVLSVTYSVVVFSVLVQGLTVGKAVRRALGQASVVSKTGTI
jgi:CPA1 family monovalent cation:H+ antiporter